MLINFLQFRAMHLTSWELAEQKLQRKLNSHQMKQGFQYTQKTATNARKPTRFQRFRRVAARSSSILQHEQSISVNFFYLLFFSPLKTNIIPK